MNFPERLRQLRKSKDWTLADLGKLVGVSKSSINMYERGEREPSMATLEAMADYFNVDLDYLSGRSDCPNKEAINLPSNILPMPAFVRKPRLGTIACGDPILAEENIEGYDEVPDTVDCDFTLVCKGDSMINARIFDGDVVYIRQQETVENGEIAAVIVDGLETEATLKRVQLYDDHIVLMLENPLYKPLVYWNEDMNRIRIIGKAVFFIGRVK